MTRIPTADIARKTTERVAKSILEPAMNKVAKQIHEATQRAEFTVVIPWDSLDVSEPHQKHIKAFLRKRGYNLFVDRSCLTIQWHR